MFFQITEKLYYWLTSHNWIKLVRNFLSNQILENSDFLSQQIIHLHLIFNLVSIFHILRGKPYLFCLSMMIDCVRCLDMTKPQNQGANLTSLKACSCFEITWGTFVKIQKKEHKKTTFTCWSKPNSCFEAFRGKLIGRGLRFIFQDTISIHSPIKAISISVNIPTSFYQYCFQFVMSSPLPSPLY